MPTEDIRRGKKAHGSDQLTNKPFLEEPMRERERESKGIKEKKIETHGNDKKI